MKDFYILENLEQIKALAEPLRVRILEAFCREPMTTKQVALSLGENPTKLYHHVEALERAGLINLVETRQNRGTTEKYYQPVAKQFGVDRKLLSVQPEEKGSTGEVIGIFTAALEDTIAEIRQSASRNLFQPEENASVAVFSRGHIVATKEQMNELMMKLQEWLKECRAVHDDSQLVRYGLTVAFYPAEKSSAKKVRSRKSEKGKNQKKPKK